MAWPGTGSIELLLANATDSSPSVRMAVLLAMRRLDRAEIARFLNDSEPLIVTEAARAINDLPISGAMPELALLANKISKNSPVELTRRVLNANYRYGDKSNSVNVARFAANSELNGALRAEALRDLESWSEPSGRDVITGLWRPVVAPRNANDARDALQPVIAELLQNGPDEVRVAAVRAALKHRLNNLGESLAKLVANTSAGSGARVEALKALGTSNDSKLTETLKTALSDPNEELRKEALRLQSQIKPSGVLGQLATALESGTIGEKQSALSTIGTMTEPGSEELVSAAWIN